MTYIPGFEHDIFVSYAHVDNHPRAGEKKGWVGQFGDDLVAAIDQDLGRKGLVSVWRDRRLSGNDRFDDTIRNAVRQSALFVSILSPGYISSSYCLTELRDFSDQEHRLFQAPAGDQARIFKIVHRHVTIEDHPGQMQDILGYHFTHFDEEAGAESLLYAARDGNPNESYYDQVRSVARRLVDLLKKMARMATIYVAETEDAALLPDRMRLLKYLRQSGFRVLPEDRLEPALPDLESNIRTDLRRSALSVHIVGPRYGKLLADGRSKLHTSFGLAALRVNSPATPLIWRRIDPGAAIDRPQQGLIDSLHAEDAERYSAEEIIDFEDLTEQITSKTFPNLSPQRSFAQRAAPDPLVYISYLPIDRPQFDQIHRYLRSEKCELVSSPAESLSEHEMVNLRFCSGMVIVYGEAPTAWVKTMAVQANDLIARGAAARMRRLSIVDGPPESKEDLGLSLSRLMVVNSRGGLQPALLKEFVASIRS
jgi:hypothetical protein